MRLVERIALGMINHYARGKTPSRIHQNPHLWGLVLDGVFAWCLVVLPSGIMLILRPWKGSSKNALMGVQFEIRRAERMSMFKGASALPNLELVKVLTWFFGRSDWALRVGAYLT